MILIHQSLIISILRESLISGFWLSRSSLIFNFPSLVRPSEYAIIIVVHLFQLSSLISWEIFFQHGKMNSANSTLATAPIRRLISLKFQYCSKKSEIRPTLEIWAFAKKQQRWKLTTKSFFISARRNFHRFSPRRCSVCLRMFNHLWKIWSKNEPVGCLGRLVDCRRGKMKIHVG